MPTIEIQSVSSPEQARLSLLHSKTADWVFFISANAAQWAHRLLDGDWPWTHARIAAIGKKTAQQLENLGLVVDLIPEKRFTTENLIATLPAASIQNAHCLIVKGVGGRDALANLLEGQGASVECVEVYQRGRPNISQAAIRSVIGSEHLGIVTVTSQLALDQLLDQVDGDQIARLLRIPLVVISERIAQHARACGFETVYIATQASDEGLLETIVSIRQEETGSAS